MRARIGCELLDDRPGDIDVAEADVTEEELTALALAADPDPPVGDDAVCLSDVGPDTAALLPEWYMPGAAGACHLRGWRRSVPLVIIAAFVLITAYGLCNTYGDLVLSTVG